MLEFVTNSIINITNINTVNIINRDNDTKPGKFRFVTKCRAGWMTIVEANEASNAQYQESPEIMLSRFKKGALQTIECKPSDSDYWFTVFAKKGNRIILMDEAIMEKLDVGTINGLWYNTNLYNQDQFRTVNAKTWADLAFKANS